MNENLRKWLKCLVCKKKYYAYELVEIGQLRTNHKQLGYNKRDRFCESCLKNKSYIKDNKEKKENE